jgi:exosome complex RNA-binding protein Rrp42 (RNase PH superfamily)
MRENNTDLISSAHASTIVSIGNTSVLCAIKFETAQPESARPNQGFLGQSLSLSLSYIQLEKKKKKTERGVFV